MMARHLEHCEPVLSYDILNVFSAVHGIGLDKSQGSLQFNHCAGHKEYYWPSRLVVAKTSRPWRFGIYEFIHPYTTEFVEHT